MYLKTIALTLPLFFCFGITQTLAQSDSNPKRTPIITLEYAEKGSPEKIMAIKSLSGQPVVEFRSYNLVPGTRDEFHKLVSEEVVPFLERWGTDLVGYGPSLHDENSYFVVRAYDSLLHREQDQNAFYGSMEWRSTYRESVLGMIENFTTVVLEMDTDAINNLRFALRE